MSDKQFNANVNDNVPMSENDYPSNSEKKSHVWVLLIVVLLIGAVGQGFYSWSISNRLKEMESAMQTQFNSHAETIAGLQDQVGMTEQNFTELQGELATTKNHLGSAQGDLRKTRQVADLLAKQQKESTEQIATQLGELQQLQADTKGTIGMLSTDVSGVRQEVGVTKQDLASTRSDLQRVIGDLGVQSGLIATNREELAELRMRGERDYFEFDLKKGKQPQRFGPIALLLKKTDVKRQKYTIDLIADDKRIEKKDKNTNEPVQFYQQGYRVPLELVINQIHKDRIVGYVSVPKQGATKVSTSHAPSVTSGS